MTRFPLNKFRFQQINFIRHFRKVWTQFMEFESTVGDLSSIKKVEKRVLASQTVSINIQILTVVIIKGLYM